jgi:hypothetical protein
MAVPKKQLMHVFQQQKIHKHNNKTTAGGGVFY